MRRPIYTDIYLTLKKEITEGQFRYNRNFPSDRELTTRFSIARETLRRALAMLENEHLIVRNQGRRTWLSFRGDQMQNFLLVYPHDVIGNTYKKIAAEADILSIQLNDFRNFSLQKLNNYLSENQISGIILCGNHFYSSETVFELLNKINIPTVLMLASNADFRFNRFSGIHLDLRCGWENALKHLADHGYRRVATCAVSDMCQIRDIPIGEYPMILRRLGLSDDPRLMLRQQCLRDHSVINNPEPFYNEIAADISRMINMDNPPDAFLCFNDHWAPPVYQAIADAGKRIPEDFAVMGFVSGQKELRLEPELTTVRLNFRKILSQAKEMLQYPPTGRKITPAKMYLLSKESIRQKNIPSQEKL
ncbi:MAG: GntR family transcriptional regulator [Lentisphaeria bacterium]|nr:GntR family transcriptional regulator [Lentisphaeria bacterium]